MVIRCNASAGRSAGYPLVDRSLNGKETLRAVPQPGKGQPAVINIDGHDSGAEYSILAAFFMSERACSLDDSPS